MWRGKRAAQPRAAAAHGGERALQPRTFWCHLCSEGENVASVCACSGGLYLQGDYVQPKFLKILEKPVPVCSFLYLQIYAIFFFFLPLCWDLIRQRTQGRRGGLLQEPFVPLSLLPLQLFFILSTASFPPAALSSFSFGSLFLGSS